MTEHRRLAHPQVKIRRAFFDHRAQQVIERRARLAAAFKALDLVEIGGRFAQRVGGGVSRKPLAA